MTSMFKSKKLIGLKIHPHLMAPSLTDCSLTSIGGMDYDREKWHKLKHEAIFNPKTCDR